MLASCARSCQPNHSSSHLLLCSDCCQEAIVDSSLQLPRLLESCKWSFASLDPNDNKCICRWCDPVFVFLLVQVLLKENSSYHFLCCRFRTVRLQIHPLVDTRAAKNSTFYFAVMQDSPRAGVRWSIIILNGLSYKDAGEYRCQARNLAGISEAPIKLKVVGVASRLPKRKSVKTGSKPSPKYRKLYKSSPLSVKDKATLRNITPSYFSKEQMLSS